MSEWTGRLSDRVAQRPPRGDNPTEQMIDVLDRACATMERQPKLSKALVRAMASPDAGVRSSGGAVRSSIADVGDPILAHLDAETRADILAVLGHVWYSALTTWANGRTDFDMVTSELHRACRVLISPSVPMPSAFQDRAFQDRGFRCAAGGPPSAGPARPRRRPPARRP